MNKQDDEVTLTKMLDEGFMVVYMGRHGQPLFFSITADIYSSKRAFDLGAEGAIHAGGCLHEEILEAFPELAPLVDIHLSDAQTGEPMHAEANSWYRYQGARGFEGGDDPGRLYPYTLKEYGCEDTLEGRRKCLYLMACKTLRVPGIPPCESHAQFAQFVNEQRERWEKEARQADALIESLKPRSVSVPAHTPSGESWSHTFDYGLQVSANLNGAGRWNNDTIGYRYVYKVIVRAPLNDGKKMATHITKFYGSVADYEENKIDAREAALGTLGELVHYLNDSVEDLAQGWGIPTDDPSPAEQETLKQMKRQARFVDKVSNAIEHNREVFS